MKEKKQDRFLYKLVDIMIKHNLFSNKGKFKVGDKVKYNWKAKAQIMNAINNNLGVHEISKIEHKTLALFKDGDSADVFWLRKTYFWENLIYENNNPIRKRGKDMKIHEKLKKHLDSLTQEEFNKEWEEIEQMGFQGPKAEGFIEHFKSTCAFKCGMITITNCSWCGRSYKNGIKI